MKNKEKILKEFDENVFGDCFAGGTFVDNEKQAMFTSGFKEGFNKAKNMSKQFLIKALAQTREETLKEIIREYQDNELDGKGYDFYFSIRAKIDELNKLKK